MLANLESRPVGLPGSVLGQGRSVVEAQPVRRYRLSDRRLSMRAMECLVTTFRCDDGALVLVLTETSDNPGPSITNCVDVLLPAVFRDLAGSGRERVRFIEHYRDDVSYRSQGTRETFDELLFDRDGAAGIVFRGWQPLWRKA